jgi:ribosomal protein S18 acetylase RimI-like enzyme
MNPDPSPPPTLAWHPATLADGLSALDLMRAFYAEEKIAFDGAAQGRALDALLSDPSLGGVFLLREDAAAPDAAPLGHLVLTRGHSLEFGGRFLLLDELYLDPAVRGRGEGRRALDFAVHQARAAGAQALRLEVSRENHRAQAAYRRAGFVAETRDLMTLRLA